MKRLFAWVVLWIYAAHLAAGCSSPHSTDDGSPSTAVRRQAISFPPPDVADDTLVPTEVYGLEGHATGTSVGIASVTPEGISRYSLPLWTPPGRAGIEPHLAFNYSSGSLNGSLGMGWSLSGLSRITRCRRTMALDGIADSIHFDSTDRFCLDGQRLMVVSGTYGADGAEYRTERDMYARIVSIGTGVNGPASFKMYTKDGHVLTFGSSGNSTFQQPAPGGGWRTYAWSLARVEDRSGNFLTVGYDVSATADEQLPAEIRYTGSTVAGVPAATRRVVFVYDTRTDVVSSFIGGFSLQLRRRLIRVEMRGPSSNGTESLLRSYKLSYRHDGLPAGENGNPQGQSVLVEVAECDGQGLCRKPFVFDYSISFNPLKDHVLSFSQSADPVYPENYYSSVLQAFMAADVNGDGRDDLVYRKPTSSTNVRWLVRYSNGASFGPEQQLDALPVPETSTESSTDGRFADLDGNGLVDFAVSIRDTSLNRRTFHLLRNESNGSFSPLSLDFEAGVARRSFWTPDINGDGRADMLRPVGGGDPVSTMVMFGRRLSPLSAGAPFSTEPNMFLVPRLINGFPVDLEGSGRVQMLMPRTDPDENGSPVFMGTNYWAVGLREDGSLFWRETSIPREDASGKRHLFLDVNGDGLPDLVSYPQDGGDATLALNTGTGFAAQPIQDFNPGGEVGPAREYLVSPPEGWGSARNSIDNGVRIADLNGDGLQDIVLMDWGNNSGNASRGHPVVLLSRGSSFILHELRNIPIGNVWVHLGMYTTLALDVNGDGLTDFAQLEGSALRTYVRQDKKPYLLLSVTDSEGARVEFDYEPITNSAVYSVGTECQYPRPCLRQGQWLASELRVDAGGGHPMRRISFHYEDGRWDAVSRRPLGFARRTVTDHVTGTVTRETYDVSTRVGAQYPLASQMTYRTIRTPLEDGKTRQRETSFTPAYVERTAADGTRYFAIYTAQMTDREYELSPGEMPQPALWTVTRTVEEFDAAFGNVKATKSQWSDGYVTRRDVAYENRSATWLVGLPTRVIEIATTALGDTRTRTSSFVYAPTSRLLTDAFVEPDSSDSDLHLHTHIDYTPEGLTGTVTTQDLLGRTRATTYDYDAATRTFVSAVTNPVGHRYQTAYHTGMGLLAESVDANGVRTRWQYDGFGRVRAEDGPTLADSSMSYQPGQIWMGLGGGGELTLHLDRLGRTVQRKTLDFTGNPVTETFIYDVAGRAVEVQNPSAANGQAVARTQYQYDALGRIIRVTHPDATFRSITYAGLSYTEKNERGHSTTTELNGRGEVLKITELNPAGGLLTTTFEYGPFGTVTATETFGRRTISEYDVLGRRTRLIDPSSGTTVTRYNAFGDVRLSVDALNEEQSFTRDALGRITHVQTSIGQHIYRWDLASNGLGALAGTTSADGISTAYSYDTLGRRIQETIEADGVLYAIDSTYDAHGRLSTLAYPAVPGATQRFQVSYGYTTRGDLLDVRNSASSHVYWQVGGRTATGHLAHAIFGNDVESHFRYDDTGSIRLIETGLGTADLQRLLYEYDAAGNLSARHDALSQTTEDFGYDSLNRLTRWTVYQNCQRSILDYTYSPDGNLTSRTVVEGSSPNETYVYGQNGAPPHALTSGPLGSYSYDMRGFQIEAPGRMVEYTPYGLPHSIRRGADVWTFRYDAFQERVRKIRSNGASTLTVGSGLYERSVEGGLARHTFSIFAGDQVVALVSWVDQNAGALLESVAYVHRDHLGSVEALSDESGVLQKRLKFDPFGRRLFTHALIASASPVYGNGMREGFTGHNHDDDLALINMRGRIYDSAVGRFLTPDPFIQAPFSSQSYNRYAYVWNNPLRYTDPTGYRADDNTICGDVPADGCEGVIEWEGLPPSDPVWAPYFSWLSDTWYATGPDGVKRPRGNGWGGRDSDRVTAGELMEMTPDERRIFMQQAAPGLSKPTNFERAELDDLFSDQFAKGTADLLRTLSMAGGVNLAVLPPMAKISQFAIMETRALTAADLGIPKAVLAELKGTLTTAGTTRIIAVEGIKREVRLTLSEVRNALPHVITAARADGMRTLQLEMTFANPKLSRFISAEVERLGGTYASVGGRDTATFLLGGP